MRKPRSPVSGSLAWVPVADEPLHHALYSDERVRIYEAVIAPGERTAFHRHDQHTLYTVIAGGKSSTEAFPGASAGAYRFPRTTGLPQLLAWGFTRAVFGWTDLPDGSWFVMPAHGRSIVHRVKASAGNRSAMRMLGIEFAPPSPTSARRPAGPSPFGRPDYEDEWLRVWALPRPRVGRPTFDGIFVITAGGRAGEFQLLPAGTALPGSGARRCEPRASYGNEMTRVKVYQM